MSTKQTLVVIGNGMVGQHFLSSLAASPAKDNYDSMFKFLNFLHPDPWKIIQQLGTVAQQSVPCGLNLSQPYA